MEISDNSCYSSHPGRTKYGLYSGSFYWSIPDFGRKHWVVVVNIDVDYKKYLDEGKTIKEIVTNCIEYLNTPPKSKYGKKRKRRPIYGLFREEPHTAKLIEKNNKKYVQALLVVNKRTNKRFWGAGEKVARIKSKNRK